MQTAVKSSQALTRDVLPKLLGFCLMLFMLSCIFDPADKILSLKVYIFVLCWVVAITISLLSPVPVSLPRGLVIYSLLFILIPVYSIVWYWLTNGSEPFRGFSMLKGYVLITLAPMLVLARIDLLPRFCVVLTVLAFAIIGVSIIVQIVPPLWSLIYVIGKRTEAVFVAERAYGSGVVLTQIYFVTSPMLAVAIAYYFDKAWSARGKSKAVYWGLVAVNMIAMFLAGTRNNILVSTLLPVVLIFYYARNRAVGALVSLGALAALVALFARELGAFFDPLEKSNSVKLALLGNYTRIFSDPVTLIFGQGLGAYEHWAGREGLNQGHNYVTELTYLEMIRNFGVLGALVVLGLLLFPIWHAFATNRSRRSKAIAIAFAFYLMMCASNPNLFSSMGILILSVMLSTIFLTDSARSSPMPRLHPRPTRAEPLHALPIRS